uniref:Adenylyl cyclase-associated protein n=1 Tax=Eptatretus burgeri TaxID=7764 RepID=A0A8C4WSZ4_EPTBU
MADFQNLVQRLEKVTIQLEDITAKGGGGTSHEAGQDKYVQWFDFLLEGPVSLYVKLSHEIGSDVAHHADMVKALFDTERALLEMASNSQKPSDVELPLILKPLSNGMEQVQAFREKQRSSKFFNHLSAVSESISALAWVTMAPKPGPYVKEMTDAAMFYTNRVLKDYKDKDKKHIEWVKSLLAMWTKLQDYIKEHHTTGLVWSKTGRPHRAACIPPGPPPPPPPPPCTFSQQPQVESTSSHSALLAEINQGQRITSGLKHVSNDMKTHKNPALRQSPAAPNLAGPKPYGSKVVSPPAASNKSASAKKPAPLLELSGKKWRVEHYENNNNLLIDQTELKQVVYIFNCNDCTVQVKGKINSITVDSCKKVALIFENVVGIVEVINSKSLQLQVTGMVPTISINKTDGCQVYLNKESLGCEIISAKSSEMNISIPHGSDLKEYPVPEQFKTVWMGSKFVTEPTEIAG